MGKMLWCRCGALLSDGQVHSPPAFFCRNPILVAVLGSLHNPGAQLSQAAATPAEPTPPTTRLTAQGGADAQFYALRRWSCLDSFVYFSHSLVTLPPPGWTNAAHTHGVRVLGTLITEWEAGAAACARLFGSAAAAVDTAQRLATLAAYFGFEGWLVNIENGMQPAHIPHLLLFLRCAGAGQQAACKVAHWKVAHAGAELCGEQALRLPQARLGLLPHARAPLHLPHRSVRQRPCPGTWSQRLLLAVLQGADGTHA